VAQFFFLLGFLKVLFGFILAVGFGRSSLLYFQHPNPSFKRDCLRSPLIQTLGKSIQMKRFYLVVFGIFTLLSSQAFAAITHEYSKKPDGSFSLKETVFSIALGSNKPFVAILLVLIGLILCFLASSAWKQQDKKETTGTTQATVTIPKTVSIKLTLGLAALGLLLGFILVVLGALLFSAGGIYTATI
jgi:hypothetical protein